MFDDLKELEDLKAALALAKEEYLSVQSRMPADVARAAHEQVKAAQNALQAAMTAGAAPCPICGTHPAAIEQPSSSGGSEFEIGCPNESCRHPIKHTDGSTRHICVRGGMLPKHAVETWNAGPGYWMKATSAEDTIAERKAKRGIS